MVDYADLGNYEFKQFDLNDYLDKFLTTPDEYRTYQEKLAEKNQTIDQLQEKVEESKNPFSFLGKLTGEVALDVIIYGLVLLLVFK